MQVCNSSFRRSFKRSNVCSSNSNRRIFSSSSSSRAFTKFISMHNNNSNSNSNKR